MLEKARFNGTAARADCHWWRLLSCEKLREEEAVVVGVGCLELLPLLQLAPLHLFERIKGLSLTSWSCSPVAALCSAFYGRGDEFLGGVPHGESAIDVQHHGGHLPLEHYAW